MMHESRRQEGFLEYRQPRAKMSPACAMTSARNAPRLMVMSVAAISKRDMSSQMILSRRAVA